MNRFLLPILCILIFLSSPLKAADQATHSVYKVTTYNLGALLGDSNNINISMHNYDPLLITSTKADIFNDQPAGSVALTEAGSSKSPHGFAIAAEYSASPQLAVQGVLGVTHKSWDSSATSNLSSWEANLGVIYHFLDNLSYQIHFGYMETGDIFSERNSYGDVESIIMISNKLTMSF